MPTFKKGLFLVRKNEFSNDVRGKARITSHFKETGMILATNQIGNARTFIAEFGEYRPALMELFWYCGENLEPVQMGNVGEFARVRVDEWLRDDPLEIVKRLFPQSGDDMESDDMESDDMESDDMESDDMESDDKESDDKERDDNGK